MKGLFGKNGGLIAVSMISFVIGAITPLLIEVDVEIIEIVLASLTTLAATFFGAKYAFSLQNQKQFEDQIHYQIEAGNKVIFNLINTYNKFCNYRDQFINEFREQPIRYLAILPAVGMEDHDEINFDSLAFLFRSEDRNILAELSLFQSQVRSTLALIKERSNLHGSVVQPALESAIGGQDIEISLKKVRDSLGERIYITLVNQTDQMIEFTDSIIADSDKLIEKLRKILKDMFPGHVIVGMHKLGDGGRVRE